MINSVIKWSIDNRFFVILIAVIWVGFGAHSLRNTSVDAIPDLSDVQVIV